MLFGYVMDLEAVNTVQYIIIEMTPVISIDSTAVHVIEDIIQDFRGRGIHVAFAMVGNRVEKTMRKAKLITMLGQQWFFPTVNDAVQYCLQHQHANEKTKRLSMELGPTGVESHCPVDLDKVFGDAISRSHVVMGSEFGLSNDMHLQYTTVFLHTREDRPEMLNDVTRLFAKHKVNIVRAQVEAQGQNMIHTYWVQSRRKRTKLTDEELDRLREDIKELHAGKAPSDNQDDRDRITQLEDALLEQSKSTLVLHSALLEQSKKLDALLGVHLKAGLRPEENGFRTDQQEISSI